MEIPAQVYTPESILPEGVDSTFSINPYTGESGQARKGTVAATLNNVARLNQLLSQEETPELIYEIDAIATAIDQLIFSLQAIGMFDFFEPVHWIGEAEQLGRILVIALYFKKFPEKNTQALQDKLAALKEKIPSPYLKARL